MIVITGLMRSGTTPLAMMLHQMGCSMGTHMSFPLLCDKPHLEWEDSSLADVLVRKINGHDPYVDETLTDYVKRRRSTVPEITDAWGVKTPFLLPFMSQLVDVCEVLREPLTVVLTERDQGDIDDSLVAQCGARLVGFLEQVRWMNDVLAQFTEDVADYASIFKAHHTRARPRMVAARLATLAGVDEPDIDVALTGIHKEVA